MLINRPGTEGVPQKHLGELWGVPVIHIHGFLGAHPNAEELPLGEFCFWHHASEQHTNCKEHHSTTVNGPERAVLGEGTTYANRKHTAATLLHMTTEDMTKLLHIEHTLTERIIIGRITQTFNVQPLPLV